MAVATSTDMLVAAETFPTVTVIVSVAQSIDDRVGAAIAIFELIIAVRNDTQKIVFFM